MVFDAFGLVDRTVALRPTPPGPPTESPGHDKHVDATFFLDRSPRLLFSTTLQGRIAAGRMKDAIDRWLGEAPSPEVTARYVPDFFEIAPTMGRQGLPVRVFLLVLRRAEPDEDPAALWEGFPARRRQLNAELR